MFMLKLAGQWRISTSDETSRLIGTLLTQRNASSFTGTSTQFLTTTLTSHHFSTFTCYLWPFLYTLMVILLFIIHNVPFVLDLFVARVTLSHTVLQDFLLPFFVSKLFFLFIKFCPCPSSEWVKYFLARPETVLANSVNSYSDLYYKFLNPIISRPDY